MKRTMGETDRSLRAVIAAVIVFLYFTNLISGIPGMILLSVAGVFALTSLWGFCPIYWTIGLSTGRKKVQLPK